LFVPSHGKAKIPGMVIALKKIAVPTFSICDFDIFNNVSPLKELIIAHGGSWSDIELKWKIFKGAIDGLKSQLNKAEVKEKIDQIIESITSTDLTFKEVESIREILKVSTAWSFAKTRGLDFVPAGDSTKACKEVIEKLNEIGIFPLLVGELESFDRTIGNGNKSKWLEEALAKDVKSDTSLINLRDLSKRG